YGNERAIKEAEKLNLNENNYYHSLLGYLYSNVDAEKAIAHYNKAISYTKSKTEKKTLMKEIERLNKKRNSS
ncbi:MAG: RNA polymerase subunit sigma, partial [Bacillota bacterium]